jgi:hypothetical protein
MAMLGRHEGLGNRGAYGAIREQPTARVKKLIESYSKMEERIGQVELDGLGNPRPTEPTP